MFPTGLSSVVRIPTVAGVVHTSTYALASPAPAAILEQQVLRVSMGCIISCSTGVHVDHSLHSLMSPGASSGVQHQAGVVESSASLSTVHVPVTDLCTLASATMVASLWPLRW